MKYEIIFYHSGKTAEIEKTADSRLKSIGLESAVSTAAVSPKELADELSASLKRVNIVLIIGGIDGGVQSTENVLSTVLSSDASSIKSHKLIDNDGNIVYLIKCQNQTIAVFPDDTAIIDKMLEAKIISELKKIYSLKQEKSDKPSMEKITGELNEQLSKSNRVRTSISIGNNEPQKPKTDKTLSAMRIAVISLIVLGCGFFAASGILLFTNLS